jgi:hypothetical protein
LSVTDFCVLFILGPPQFSFESNWGIALTTYLPSSARVKKRVELYLYFPYGPSQEELCFFLNRFTSTPFWMGTGASLSSEKDHSVKLITHLEIVLVFRMHEIILGT